jgi:hypothetical protein
MSDLSSQTLDSGLLAFAQRAVARERVFGVLAWVGVAAGLGLAAWYGLGGHETAGALEWVVVVLVLLNARQNLRQAKYARTLSCLLDRTSGSS